MDFSQKVRAARAAAKWMQEELAARSGLSLQGIKQIENELTSPTARSQKAIREAFEAEGWFMTESGIEYRPNQVRTVSDYLDVLADAALALPGGGEILCHCASESRSSDAVRARKHELAAKNILFRYTICEGDKNYFQTPDSYRWIPEDIFQNSQVMLFYANTAVMDAGENYVLFRHPLLASVLRRQLFDYWWERGKEIG